jgi:polyisoprenoid-binding protein YceI
MTSGKWGFFTMQNKARAAVLIGAALLLFPAARPMAADPAPPAPSAAAVRYRIAAGQSRITVRAFAGGLFSVFAHDHTIAARDFDGEVTLIPGAAEGATLRLAVRAGALAVVDQIGDADRKEIEATMRGEVLEAAKYPEIVFQSARVTARQNPDGGYRVEISGDLTLHGVTRRLSFSADVTLDGGTLRAAGRFPLLQTDYQIAPVSVAGGTIRVKDELQLSFDIVAVRQ